MDLPDDAPVSKSFYLALVHRRWSDRAILVRAGIAPLDGALALTLAIAAPIEVVLTRDPQVPGILAAAGVVMSLALAARRRAPLAVALIMALVFATKSFLGSPPDASAVPVLALLLGAYAVATYASHRSAAVGAGVMILAIWVSLFPYPPLGFSDFFFPVTGVLGPWLAGLVVRRRTGQAELLAHRTVALERDREALAQAAVAAERRRIARELHDVIAHSVSVMILQAGAAEWVVRQDVERAAESLASVQDTGRHALAELGRLLGFLREHGEEIGIAPQPTLHEVDSLVAQTREAGLQVSLHREGTSRPLPPGVDLAAYRIVQEALTNALKHAGAARVDVTLRYGVHELGVEIIDDGHGNGSGGGNGQGLVGMRERVALYGGELDLGARPGGGFAIRARLPVEDLGS